MEIRSAQESDFDVIIVQLDDWWGGRSMVDKLPRLFLEHFSDTSFVVEDRGDIVGLLIGFLSQSRPKEAHIHFVGVHPDYRGREVASRLYERFFAECRNAGRRVVRCNTSPVNHGSIAFHTRMGFRLVPGDVEIDGAPVSSGYDGPGQDRVVFVKEL